MTQATKPKSGRGGKRPGAGRKKGTPLPARTIERIRASINSKLCIDTLHALAENGGKHDGVRATAALGLLQFVVPKLSATDVTSNGESITVERVSFKRDGK
jgi:hypothetical protein